MYKVILFLVIALAVNFNSLYQVAGNTTCEERMYLNQDGLCCPMCKPGQFLKKNCSSNAHTICEACQPGTFTKQFNTETKCRACSARQYYDENLSSCRPCRVCPFGQYPAVKCEMTKNTECEACPEDTFASNITGTCKPCTKCDSYVRACTTEMDAVCEIATTVNPTTNNPTTRKITDPTTINKIVTTVRRKNASNDESNQNAYIILAVVLVLFLAAVIIVVVCLYARKTSCNGLPRNGNDYLRLETGLLLRNQSAAFFLKLVEFFTAEGRPNWKNLAAAFRDFSYEEIANFAVDKSTAAEKMLAAWQTKNTATVDKLHSCCLAIKREDVATYIAEYFSGDTATLV